MKLLLAGVSTTWLGVHLHIYTQVWVLHKKVGETYPAISYFLLPDKTLSTYIRVAHIIQDLAPITAEPAWILSKKTLPSRKTSLGWDHWSTCNKKEKVPQFEQTCSRHSWKVLHIQWQDEVLATHSLVARRNWSYFPSNWRLLPVENYT